MPEHEVLELLLFGAIARKNTNPLAHDLINKFGSFKGVLDADIRDLLKVKGVGEDTASYLALFPLLFEYYNKNKWGDRPQLVNSAACGLYVVDNIGNKNDEVFMLICLDTQRKVISTPMFIDGGRNETGLDLRKIVEETIKNKAVSIILSHNHPSGSLIPSHNDILATQEIIKILEPMNIMVIDHIIAAGDKYISFTEKGII